MRTLLIAAALGAASLSAPAQAQSYSIEVETWMLETHTGTERVYAMLERHANRACQFRRPDSRILVRDRACSDDLLGQFVSGIESQRLAALHEARSGVRHAEKP